MKLSPATPSSLGFRMPAEWEPHSATWLSWPHKEESWPGRFYDIPEVFADIVRVLSSCERVNINVLDAPMRSDVISLLRDRCVDPGLVSFHLIRTDDAWIRDHGPIFVTRPAFAGDRGNLAVVDWLYNAWGGKYPPWENDDRVPGTIAEIRDLPLFQPGIVLEGGSIDVNGRGSLMTTESCLLNPNRNPGLSRCEIEGCLKAYLGASNILWLGNGIVGDDTDGHIDDLARFVSPTSVVAVIEDDPLDDNYEVLRDNLRILRSMCDQDGNAFNVSVLPMPSPIFIEGHRVPASYANFYIANRVVVVPTFADSHDALALSVLQGLFPSRKVVGIDCRSLVWGLGAVHCVTQQEPIAGLASSSHRESSSCERET